MGMEPNIEDELWLFRDAVALAAATHCAASAKAAGYWDAGRVGAPEGGAK